MRTKGRGQVMFPRAPRSHHELHQRVAPRGRPARHQDTAVVVAVLESDTAAGRYVSVYVHGAPVPEFRGTVSRPVRFHAFGDGSMARSERFERPTARFEVWCSIQL